MYVCKYVHNYVTDSLCANIYVCTYICTLFAKVLPLQICLSKLFHSVNSIRIYVRTCVWHVFTYTVLVTLLRSSHILST